MSYSNQKKNDQFIIAPDWLGIIWPGFLIFVILTLSFKHFGFAWLGVLLAIIVVYWLFSRAQYVAIDGLSKTINIKYPFRLFGSKSNVVLLNFNEIELIQIQNPPSSKHRYKISIVLKSGNTFIISAGALGVQWIKEHLSLDVHVGNYSD